MLTPERLYREREVRVLLERAFRLGWSAGNMGVMDLDAAEAQAINSLLAGDAS